MVNMLELLSRNVAFILIGITVITSMMAWSNQVMYQKWIFHPYSVQKHKQYLRFLTCGFIHGDYAHLFFNMFTLFFFASHVQRGFEIQFQEKGLLYFLILYVGAIIISVVPTYLKHKEHAYYKSLGASGGVSAIVFSSIMFDPTESLYLMFIPVRIPAFIFAVLYLFYSAYQARKSNDHINHDAHLFGALFGIGFTLLLIPNLIHSFIERVSSFVSSF